MADVSNKKYRVGAVGCGRKGTGQARAFDLHPMTQLVAAADTDPENLALFCERFGVPGYSSYEEMIDKEKIDIASTILPTGANPEVVIGCARRGVKAILCEKPMAASLEEADRVVETCRALGIPLGAGDMFRNLAQFWKAREIIDSGEMGEVQIINVYHNSDQISGTGCQPLSVMRLFAKDADVDWAFGWVTGAAAEDSLEVKPRLDAFSDHDQGMEGTFHFSNGIQGYIHYKKTPKDEIEVLCSKGMFTTDYRSFHLLKSEAGATPKERGRSGLKEIEGVFQDSVRGYQDYHRDGWKSLGSRVMDTVQSIVDSLELGFEPRSSGDNARKVLEMAIGLRESERRGMRAVKFTLADRRLKLVPKKGRMYNKKEVYGREWYQDQISGLKRA